MTEPEHSWLRPGLERQRARRMWITWRLLAVLWLGALVALALAVSA
jgi:hypothetical protein